MKHLSSVLFAHILGPHGLIKLNNCSLEGLYRSRNAINSARKGKNVKRRPWRKELWITHQRMKTQDPRVHSHWRHFPFSCFVAPCGHQLLAPQARRFPTLLNKRSLLDVIEIFPFISMAWWHCPHSYYFENGKIIEQTAVKTYQGAK